MKPSIQSAVACPKNVSLPRIEQNHYNPDGDYAVFPNPSLLKTLFLYSFEADYVLADLRSCHGINNFPSSSTGNMVADKAITRIHSEKLKG